MGRRRADEKFFVRQRDQEHNIHYTTINKYDITYRWHLGFKIQISTLDSMFLFHITVLINYTRLNCRIKFYLKSNNAYFTELMTCNIFTYFAWLFLFSCYAAVKEDWWYTSFRDDLAISTSLPWHFSRVFCICWAAGTSGRFTTPAWYLPWYSSCTWQQDIRASQRYYVF